MKKAGRPKKEINFEIFEKLCPMLPTAVELASFFDVSVDTLERRLKEHYKTGFSELLKRFGDKGKISLRRLMFRHALTSPAMAIFLAKNLLGMSDQPKIETEQVDRIILITEEEENILRKHKKE